jgi:F-type H+-transporting ATPase subunit epsilon
MSSIHFLILTPNRTLIDEKDVEEVYFPTEHGSVGILPDHAPMVTTVGTGVVVYSQKNVSGFLKVAGGIAEVLDNTVTLLVDTGEEASNIDVNRAKRALERAEGRLAAKDLGNIDVKRAQAAKKRAQARIQTAELYQTKTPKNQQKDNSQNS